MTMRALTLSIATLLVAGHAGAQVVHGRAAPPVRRGGIAPPPAAPPAATPAPMPGSAVPVAMGHVPAVLLSDGRVFADFGRGFEQVLRSCDTGWHHALAEPPQTYSAPVLSAGAGAVTPVQSAPAQARSQAGAPCWTRQSNGTLVVVRP